MPENEQQSVKNTNSLINNLSSFLGTNQSQIATVLIGVLLVIAGALTYNYFRSQNQPQKQKVSFGQIVTPIPSNKIPTQAQQKMTAGKTYTVVSGDSLWNIANEKLGNGYRWKEIASLNNISQSEPILHAGQILNLPETGQVAGGATVKGTGTQSTSSQTGNLPATYTVVHGDTLWSIAEKFYGTSNGSQWHLIFDYAPNRLSMFQAADGHTYPLIHAGNVLTIPAIPQT